jgi:hypothetical protein
MRKATCTGCKRIAWVNSATRGGNGIGEYCADCYEDLEHDQNDAPKTSPTSGASHSNPWQENAIRALENLTE